MRTAGNLHMGMGSRAVLEGSKNAGSPHTSQVHTECLCTFSNRHVNSGWPVEYPQQVRRLDLPPFRSLSGAGSTSGQRMCLICGWSAFSDSLVNNALKKRPQTVAKLVGFRNINYSL